MDSTAPSCCKSLHLLLTAAVFAAAYGQAPLYYSNQNQYFLHGFAAADYGLLREDWLANTLDPTPLFSVLVELTIRHMPAWTFHVYQAVMMGIYAAAMLNLFAFLAGPQVAARRWPIFALLFVLVHSAAARWTSCTLLGGDYPWYFQAGVASQYVVGAMFQPSAFGVLLVLAVSFFVRGQWILCSACVALAGIIHNTYLLAGAMLTVGFLAQLFLERRWRDGLLFGGLTFVLVLPFALWSMHTFAATNPAAFDRAQDILANFRIPHHARIDYWLDGVAVLQILWIILGIGLAWRTRLFVVLLVSFLLAALLTLLQAATGNNFLALLFPWRLSTVLVPIATTIVLARLVGCRTVCQPAEGQMGSSLHASAWPTATAMVGLLILASAGLVISFGRFAFQSLAEDVPMMDFVKQTRKLGDVYFLPVNLPNRSKLPAGFVRSLSGDFKQLPQRQQDSRLISLDLQQFRLHTGTPIFVDFKSIPYKDVEVIQWYNRLRMAADVRASLEKGECEDCRRHLRAAHVTHVVWPAKAPELKHPEFQLIYGGEGNVMHADAVYRIYQLIGSP